MSQSGASRRVAHDGLPKHYGGNTMPPLVRTQIQLTESQHRALRRWAGRLGISLAEAVRRCVAEQLAREESPAGRADRVREAEAVIGKYASGRSDVAERHDEYLSDAFSG